MNIIARMRGPLAMKLRFQPGDKGNKGDKGDAATVEVGAVTTGAPGSPAAVTNVGTAAAAIFDFDIPEGDKGEAGDNGWTPELATVTDSARRVHQVVDWFGGAGTKPATGDYVGPTGLTPTIGDAVDIRGPAGTATIPDGDKGDITTSSGGTVWTIDGGYVPKTGGVFTGPVGIDGNPFLISGAAGSNRPIRWDTDGYARWEIGAGGQPETGENAGSFFYLARMSDAGAYLDQPIYFNRATGQATFLVRPNWGATPWDSANLPAPVVDSVYAEFTTYSTTTDIIMLDDTIPQNSEGSQILSVAISPKSTTNKLRIKAEIPFAIGAVPGSAVAGLFHSGSADAIASDWRYDNAGQGGRLHLSREYTPGTTSSVTISARIGKGSSDASLFVAINGFGAGRLMGGSSRATLIVEEIKS